MKQLILLTRFSVYMISLLVLTVTTTMAQALDGAWRQTDTSTGIQMTCIIEDNYFMRADYDKANKKFISTIGGTCTAVNGKMDVTIEFNTDDASLIGNSFTLDYRLDNEKLVTIINGESTNWTRIDDGKGALAGNWRITEREQDGKLTAMNPGPRKTLKILSGSRFQWAAINTDTKEFFGTGGGTYTFNDGQYTEMIEFFSRDSSRVGMSLSFEGKVEGKRWQHSGKSSKGDRIAEIWTRQGL